jgi:hypothetical protein
MSILRGLSLGYFLLCVSFFWPSFVKAESIRGVLIRKSSDSVLVRLEGSSESPMALKPVYQNVLTQLNKLKSGDTLQGSGHFRGSESGDRVVMLESIDFVGVRNLLGTWIARNSAVVDFIDFDRVRVLMPSAIGLKRYHLTYSLAPSNESDWMIFLRDSESVVLGSLNLTKKRVVIDFVEPESRPDGGASLELIRVSN